MATKILEAGAKAPAFKGETLDGVVASKDLKGTAYVLYFYPKDNTPGCTTQACDFRDSLAKFKKMKVAIYGVSKDSLKSHQKFTDKFDLPFPLISDPDGKICDFFGVWVEKSMFGRKYMGIERATFLIDENGVIQHVWRKVKAAGHVDKVIEKYSELNKK